MPGSPPPTRGTQCEGSYQTDRFGITPAYAGNTYPDFVESTRFGDHPRLRGEHDDSYIIHQDKGGSPPPTRGTHNFAAAPAESSGITPAYAGNTYESKRRDGKVWDHPRLRGEHDHVHNRRVRRKGSPPPTRGTLLKQVSVRPQPGITPAYAGNT